MMMRCKGFRRGKQSNVVMTRNYEVALVSEDAAFIRLKFDRRQMPDIDSWSWIRATRAIFRVADDDRRISPVVAKPILAATSAAAAFWAALGWSGTTTLPWTKSAIPSSFESDTIQPTENRSVSGLEPGAGWYAL
jgi:hypothetical protein